MKPTKAMILANKLNTLARLGFSTAEAFDLFKIERRLNLFYTNECNGEIERDEKTGKVYRFGFDRTKRFPSRDLETAALRKLDLMMSTRPHLTAYVQTDPRGASLYILEEKDKLPNLPIESYYSRGYCVYNR